MGVTAALCEMLAEAHDSEVVTATCWARLHGQENELISG
jgi:hypothetical protein